MPGESSERASDPVVYEDVKELRDTWRSHFERLMDARGRPDDEVTVEWDTTDDEAVLRLSEPPEAVVTEQRGGSLHSSRTIWQYFDRAIDAAHETHRCISTQQNPMGPDERKHRAMLAIPLADNWDRWDA